MKIDISNILNVVDEKFINMKEENQHNEFKSIHDKNQNGFVKKNKISRWICKECTGIFNSLRKNESGYFHLGRNDDGSLTIKDMKTNNEINGFKKNMKKIREWIDDFHKEIENNFGLSGSNGRNERYFDFHEIVNNMNSKKETTLFFLIEIKNPKEIIAKIIKDKYIYKNEVNKRTGIRRVLKIYRNNYFLRRYSSTMKRFESKMVVYMEDKYEENGVKYIKDENHVFIKFFENNLEKYCSFYQEDNNKKGKNKIRVMLLSYYDPNKKKNIHKIFNFDNKIIKNNNIFSLINFLEWYIYFNNLEEIKWGEFESIKKGFEEYNKNLSKSKDNGKRKDFIQNHVIFFLKDKENNNSSFYRADIKDWLMNTRFRVWNKGKEIVDITSDNIYIKLIKEYRDSQINNSSDKLLIWKLENNNAKYYFTNKKSDVSKWLNTKIKGDINKIKNISNYERISDYYYFLGEEEFNKLKNEINDELKVLINLLK